MVMSVIFEKLPPKIENPKNMENKQKKHPKSMKHLDPKVLPQLKAIGPPGNPPSSPKTGDLLAGLYHPKPGKKTHGKGIFNSLLDGIGIS